MQNMYFNVKIEFDKDLVESIILKTITGKGKGYLCAIESNNLTVANLDKDFLKVVNESLVNICDGSVLARILGIIHKRKFRSYIGDDLMKKFISMCQFRHFFLGNTREILDGLRNNLSRIDPLIINMPFESLPFLKVEEFDYSGIADKINNANPDIIWVSLGAPKQEFFMSRLLPYLNRGVMCGVGAAFNFNAGTGPVKRAPRLIRRLYLEWLYRAFEEPEKNIPRYCRFIRILPRLICHEFKRSGKERP